jgi:serine/threonine protein kinase
VRGSQTRFEQGLGLATVRFLMVFFVVEQPENLLLDTDGNLKISDFGLSALHQQVRVCLGYNFFMLSALSPIFVSFKARFIQEHC